MYQYFYTANVLYVLNTFVFFYLRSKYNKSLIFLGLNNLSPKNVISIIVLIEK
jgi:hypothetical protein